MLRYAFLRSDYHPQILILGDRIDLGGLATILRGFAEGGTNEATIPHVAGEAPDTQTALVLRNGEATGAAAGGVGCFVWTLDAENAATFSDAIARLATTEDQAGSEMLETGTAGEIPVKVSRGEYTDDFLLSVS